MIINEIQNDLGDDINHFNVLSDSVSKILFQDIYLDLYSETSQELSLELDEDIGAALKNSR